jgi:hypothetical protein
VAAGEDAVAAAEDGADEVIEAVDEADVAALADASVFGVEVPAIPAAYAVMCVRTSISLARVASSIVVADFAVVPLVPTGVGVLGVADSLPTIWLMALSMAATSVPQFVFDALDFEASAGEALADEPTFSRLARCFLRSARSERFFAGTAVASIEFRAL